MNCLVKKALNFRMIYQKQKVILGVMRNFHSHFQGTHNALTAERFLQRATFSEVYAKSRCYTTETIEMTSTHDKLLEAHFFGVETYGKLDVTTPFDVVIEPLDEQKYPEMNKCFIKLFYDSEAEDNLDCLTLDSIKNLYEFKVNKKDRKAITIEAKYKTSVEVPVLCKIQAPLKFDLHVSGESKNVQISKMECSTINVDLDDNKSDSQTGQKKTSSCTLNSIKSGNVNIKCRNGDIISKRVLQSNACLETTGEGVIKCDRVQAQTVSMTTELGNISATSVYVPQSSFSSDYGDIDLNNCHSNCTVKINQGNLKIGSFEGNLDADLHTGSVDIYMTRPKEVKVTTQSGDVSLKLLERLKASFRLEGTKIEGELVDSNLIQTEEVKQVYEVHSEDEESGRVTVKTGEGSIVVQKQDWLSSLLSQKGI